MGQGDSVGDWSTSFATRKETAGGTSQWHKTSLLQRTIVPAFVNLNRCRHRLVEQARGFLLEDRDMYGQAVRSKKILTT